MRTLESDMIIVNGVKFPPPVQGFTINTTQAVDADNNSLNEFIGQKAGRRKWKLSNLQWTDLPVDTWKKMKEALEPFVVPVTFTDDDNIRRTIHMYPSDTSATPARMDNSKIFYKQHETCKFNLIDCGWLEDVQS